MLAPGRKLSHYEVLGPLGACGMGEVYRARDTRLGREVAIKVLPNPGANARATWNGRGERGEEVPPGVYLARVTTGAAVEWVRVLKLR